MDLKKIRDDAQVKLSNLKHNALYLDPYILERRIIDQQLIVKLCEYNEHLNNDLLDVLDLKEGNGPTALAMVVEERDFLREEIVKLNEALAILDYTLWFNYHKTYDDMMATPGRVQSSLLDFSDMRTARRILQEEES